MFVPAQTTRRGGPENVSLGGGPENVLLGGEPASSSRGPDEDGRGARGDDRVEFTSMGFHEMGSDLGGYGSRCSVELDDVASIPFDGVLPIPDDETVVESWIQISVASALRSPDREHWLAAISREETRLKSYQTWGPPLSAEELRGISQAVAPLCILLTRKRDNSFKARCVVLGNRIRKLQKALYGLRQAPRLWHDCLKSYLVSLGWFECLECNDLWKKKSVSGGWMKLSVYVDDCICAGPDETEVLEEVKKITDKFPGNIIQPKVATVDGLTGLLYDILGADVFYCREHKYLKISMSSYIQKVLKKYFPDLKKSVVNPSFDASKLEEGELVSGFPVREVLGCLGWVVTSCRPDIACPVGILSQYVSKPVTKNFVNAVRLVCRYLIGTMEDGLVYSPEREREFEMIYAQFVPGRPFPRKAGFGDASFASCFITLRSTSGAILYWRGVGIVWRRHRQTVRSNWTAESEFIAQSDLIVLSESNNFTSFFDSEQQPRKILVDRKGELPTSVEDGDYVPPQEDEVLFCDSEAALAVARSQENRPRSRHFALRWARVREKADLLCFCPTDLMKADALTKVDVSSSQRRLVLHHIQPSRWKSKTDEVENDVCDDEVGSEQVMSFGYMFSGEECAVVGLELDLNEYDFDDVLL